jgi:hypothetical protein
LGNCFENPWRKKEKKQSEAVKTIEKIPMD